MNSLLPQYAERIAGVLSCYDRLILWGTLPVVSHEAGLAHFCHERDLPLHELKAFAGELRDQLEAHLQAVAREAGVQIEYLRSAQAVRKEARIQEILATRGEHPGLVHLFAVVEPSRVFDVRSGGPSGQPYLRQRRGTCKHYYLYFIDPQFGLCHLRLSTWLPFYFQFYCNGHSWLAREMQRAGLAFTQVDNAFTACADWSRAQELADAFPMRELHQALDRWADAYCPVARALTAAGYHWSIAQAEYATDVVFTAPADLQPLYDHLRQQAIFTVKAEDIATFVGRPLPRNPEEAGLGSSLRTTTQGARVRHQCGRDVSLKLYDKHGVMLRIETTVNNVSFFQHHREVVHRDGTSTVKLAPMRKTLYSLRLLAACMGACNRRYLSFLTALADPTDGQAAVVELGERQQADGRSYPGFNLFTRRDLGQMLALTRGEWSIRGFTNGDLRRHLRDQTAGQVSRLLKRLRLHGLIHRMTRSYRYRLTEAGQRVVLAALRLREEVGLSAAAL